MGGFKEFNKGAKVAFFPGDKSQATFFKIWPKIKPKNKMINVQEKGTGQKSQKQEDKIIVGNVGEKPDKTSQGKNKQKRQKMKF